MNKETLYQYKPGITRPSTFEHLYEMYRLAARNCFTCHEAQEEMDVINNIIDKKLEPKKEKRGHHVWP